MVALLGSVPRALGARLHAIFCGESGAVIQLRRMEHYIRIAVERCSSFDVILGLWVHEFTA